jgi:integrase
MVTNSVTDKREALGSGLYRRTRGGKTFFEVRYSINGKRRFTALKSTKLTMARIEAGKLVARIAEEQHDPVAEKKRSGVAEYRTVHDVARYWQQRNSKRLKHPNVPNRRYDNHVKPYIGELAVLKVTSADIVSILRKLDSTPGAANKVLIDLKQIFGVAVKLGVLKTNFVREFNPSDAGGKEQPRERSLSRIELKQIFEVLRNHPDRFTRDNYLMVLLLIALAVRKGELQEAKWAEFDLESGKWLLPAERTKTGAPILIPLSQPVAEWLNELKVRACGSEYVFPNRRTGSSGRKHMGKDTLNRAIAAMFGISQSSDSRVPENEMGEIEPFVPHDLRRTARTLLSELGVAPHIAERCLNHKLTGVMAVYDQHDFFEERRIALNELSKFIHTITKNEKV